MIDDNVVTNSNTPYTADQKDNESENEQKFPDAKSDTEAETGPEFFDMYIAYNNLAQKKSQTM